MMSVGFLNLNSFKKRIIAKNRGQMEQKDELPSII